MLYKLTSEASCRRPNWHCQISTEKRACVKQLGLHSPRLRSAFDEIPRVRQFSPNLGAIWVRYAGSKNSLEDEERAVSTVEIH